MAETVTISLQHLARSLSIPVGQVQTVVELLDEGNTVPFITRYRKDETDGLDEEQIRQIQTRLGKLRMLAERKQTILRSIQSQGKLSEKLGKQILSANTTKRLEDLYLPFKPKKQTLATVARERGLEPLAEEILSAAAECADLDARAADFVNPDKGVPTHADALLGAGHVLAEQFSERAEVRQRLREVLQRTGKIVSTGIVPNPPKAASAPPEKPITPAVAPPEATASTEPASTDQSNEEPAEKSLAEPLADPSAQTPGAPVADEDRSEPAETQQTQGALEEQKQQRQQDPSARVTAEAKADSAEPPPAEPAARTTPPKARKVDERLTKAQLRKKQAQERKLKAFRDYFDCQEEISKIPPHRLLAVNRGERARVLRVKLEYDTGAVEKVLDELLVPPDHPHAEFLRGCARDALARLILPSLIRELRRELTDRAENHAVAVFARNLRNLLLQPPIHGRRVLAVDPGFKSGCKLAALDQFGNLLEHAVVYLVGRRDRRERAKRKVKDLIDRFGLTVVTIGNGTACRETEDFFAKLIDQEYKDGDVAYVIVNEAGASVYSTSPLGREEFPRYDATLRGAISIGRRLQDPLSELVKIDPASIGVGLYQHDVKAKHLRMSLDGVVESCVNYVGVDVNTASPALLRYVSGLNQLTARRIYEYRLQNGPFRTRDQFREVPGFGEAAFVQAAGFLKIPRGDQPLDATWIHPESYEIASQALALLSGTPADLAEKETALRLAERVKQLDLAETAGRLGVGLLLLEDIVSQLTRPGRDPREDLPSPVFKRGVLKLEDLSPGMELRGTVLNVVDFGAFVDIGMHDSGLVHVSQLANKFVRDPHEVVAVGEIVKVWVVGVDKDRRRVSLTMIAPGSEPPARGRGARREATDGRKPAARTERSGDRQGARDRPRRPKGPPRPTKGKHPPRGKHKPKSRPKPLVPITEDMKEGKEAMRTFGDLAQFFQHKQSPNDSSNNGPEQAEPTQGTQSEGQEQAQGEDGKGHSADDGQ